MLTLRSAIRPFALGLLAAGLFAARPAAALTGDPAVTLDNSTANSFATDTGGNAGFTGTLGFSFTPNQAVALTALGYYDDSLVPGSGTTTFGSHDVGLYDSLGTLLASSTLTSASTADGDFVYNDLFAPVALLPGVTYTLGGVAGADDPYAYDLQNANPFDSRFTYDQDAFDTNGASSTTLTDPTSTDGSPADPNNPFGYAYFGPTFRLAPAGVTPPPAVPEPAPLTLLALGLLPVGLVARRRAR